MQIKLLTLDSTNITLNKQIDKIEEEFNEVYADYLAGDYQNLAEELIDLQQACKTSLEILENYKICNVELANIKHIAKLKQRASEGKIKLIED